MTEGHNLTLDQVRKCSAWFMGGETATLTIPLVGDRLAIKAVDPNKGSNIGLVNRRKILLNQYSGMINVILKNHLERTSFTLLNPSAKIFDYKGEASRRTIAWCGLIKLKLVLELVNANLVVNYSLKEEDPENLTLADCGDNVHVYLRALQEKRNGISSNLPGKEEYPVHRFVTAMFVQLEKSPCTDFLNDVRDSKSRWVED